MFKLSEKNGTVLVFGKVEKLFVGSGDYADKLTNVKLVGSDYDKSTKTEVDVNLEIAFWDDEPNVQDSGKNLSSRLKAAKVHEGSYISVYAVLNKNGKYKALAWKYTGKWMITDENGEEVENWFIGPVTRLDERNDGNLARVTMRDGYGENVTWPVISFFNGKTRDGREIRNADHAKSWLTPAEGKERPFAIIKAGKNEPYNGKPSYRGIAFEVLKNK